MSREQMFGAYMSSDQYPVPRLDSLHFSFEAAERQARTFRSITSAGWVMEVDVEILGDRPVGSRRETA